MARHLPFLLAAALLLAGSVPLAESIEQADLSPCDVVVDFEALPSGPQPNPLGLVGVAIQSPTSLAVYDIAPYAAGYSDVVSGQVLTTVVDPSFAGQHFPMTLTFSTPVAEVGLGWWDPNSSGNVLRAYDASGALLEEVAPSLFSTGGCCADFVGIRRPTAEIASVVVQNADPSDFYAIDFLTFGAGQPSAEVVRLGAPPNPAALEAGATQGPVTGGVWDPRIDHTTFLPAAAFDFLGITAHPANVPVPPLGTLLCDPALTFAVESTPAGQAFAVPIPDDCAYVGATACAQGASLDAVGNVRLTNALDITIGTL